MTTPTADEIATALRITADADRADRLARLLRGEVA